MATWLTSYYALSMLVLLAVASGALYWELERNLLRQDQDFLASKSRVLASLIVEQSPNRAGIEQEVLEEAEISRASPLPFYSRVLDGRDDVVAETPGMMQFWQARGPNPAAAPLGFSKAGRSREPRMLRSESSVTGPSGEHWRIQVAVDVSAHLNLLSRYRTYIGLVLSVGLVAAIVMGAWITRRGLQPIAQITLAAERINVRQLNERIEKGPWPRELVALAGAFDRMLERLELSFTQLSQFSADLAHELRTPINNMMGEAQVAIAHPRTADEYARVLHSELEECNRLARMIDSMLFLARADRNASALEKVQVDAKTELQAVAEFYQAVADEEGKFIVIEGTVGLRADQIMLRRALSNLVSNALKYTPTGGTVTLRAALEPDGAARLSVSDTGCGISSQHLPRLGDRFYRVDPSRTAAPGGTGLGLAIVKSIMTLHGGYLHIESALGLGTTVAMVFGATEGSSASV